MKIERFNENKIEHTFDWEKFKNYVNTYDPKTHGGDNWQIILQDMLYGLGISIDDEYFKYVDGYKKFKQYLKDDIDWKIKENSKKYNL